MTPARLTLLPGRLILARLTPAAWPG